MANTTIVIKARDATKKAFSSVNKGLGKMRTGLNSTQVKVGLLAGVAGFGALIKSSSKMADALAKTSDKLGLTTEALAVMQNAGELTGVSSETMNMALQRMTRRLSEAAQGTGEAKNAIVELGLDAQQLASSSPDQAFEKIAEAMGSVASQGDKVRLAMKFFDSEGVALVNTLDLQAEGLQRVKEETKLFGLALSRVDAAKIEMANDEMTRIGQITKGFGLQLTTELAPILEGVASLFVENAKEAGGFGNVAMNVIDGLVTGVGYVANAFRGMEIIWAGLRVAFAGMYSFVIGKLNDLQQSVVGFINIIPGIDIKPFQGLAIAASSIEHVFVDAQAELMSLMMQPLPSENIDKWLEKVREKQQLVAEEIAATKAAAGGSGAGDVGAVDLNSVEAEKDNQRLAEKLARLDQSLLSEQERLLLGFEEKEFIIEESFQNGLIKDIERTELLLSIEQDKQDRLSAIEKRGLTEREKFEKKSTGDKIKTQLSLMAQMTQGVAGNSKAMFKINKALALANAAVSLPDAVIQTFRNNGGYPWGVAPAALMAATGAAQIAAISSSSFGGKGGAAPVSGGSVAPSLIGTGIDSVVGTKPVDDNASTTSTINIIVNGVLTPEIIDETLMPAIRDSVDNRDVILISNGSRNAQELAPA